MARIISRRYLVRFWGWDDTLVIIAWLGLVGLVVLFGLATAYGQGHHISTVSPEMLVKSLHVTYGTLICSQWALTFTKLTILVFYIRIFVSRREQWLAGITIALVIVYSIPLFVGSVMQCNTTTGGFIFDKRYPCLKYNTFLLVATTVHVVTDIWLILMVMPVTISLKIPVRQKIALLAVFSLGVFVIAASIAKLLVVTLLVQEIKEGTADYTWDIYSYDIWTVLEVAVGIIVANAPTMRPILARLFPRFMSNSSLSSDKRDSNTASYMMTGSRKDRHSNSLDPDDDPDFIHASAEDRIRDLTSRKSHSTKASDMFHHSRTPHDLESNPNDHFRNLSDSTQSTSSHATSRKYSDQPRSDREMLEEEAVPIAKKQGRGMI